MRILLIYISGGGGGGGEVGFPILGHNWETPVSPISRIISLSKSYNNTDWSMTKCF